MTTKPCRWVALAMVWVTAGWFALVADARQAVFTLPLSTEYAGGTVDADGNTYFAGRLSDPVDFDPGPGEHIVDVPHGRSDAFVASYDRVGSLRFAFPLSHTEAGQYLINGMSMDTDGDGNVYLAGAFNGKVDFDPGPGERSLTWNDVSYTRNYLASYDSTGALRFAFPLGRGTHENREIDIAVGDSGQIFVLGRANCPIDLDPGDAVVDVSGMGIGECWLRYVYLASYDLNGSFLFGFRLGTPAGWGGGSLATDESGNVYVAGRYHETLDLDPAPPVNEEPAGAAFLASYDRDGALRFGFRIAGEPQGFEFSDVAVNASGRILVLGNANDDADLDPGPGTRGIRLSGRGPGKDAFIAAYDSYGRFESAAVLNGEWTADRGNSYAGHIALDRTANIYVAGTFQGQRDFDPVGSALLTSRGWYDTFVVSYTPEYHLRWAYSIGDAETDTPHGMEVDAQGLLHVWGKFQGTVDLDPGPGVAEFTTGPDRWGFFALSHDPDPGRLLAPETAPTSITAGLEVSAYPTPFRESTRVVLRAATPAQSEVTVIDLLGRRVRLLWQGLLLPGEPRTVVFEAGDLPSGPYFVCTRHAGLVTVTPVLLTR